jgi:hypothetical protein
MVHLRSEEIVRSQEISRTIGNNKPWIGIIIELSAAIARQISLPEYPPQWASPQPEQLRILAASAGKYV